MVASWFCSRPSSAAWASTLACDDLDLGGQFVDAVERPGMLLVELADLVLECLELVGDHLDPLTLIVDGSAATLGTPVPPLNSPMATTDARTT